MRNRARRVGESRFRFIEIGLWLLLVEVKIENSK